MMKKGAEGGWTEWDSNNNQKKKKKRNHIHENLFGTSITPRVWILRFERIQIKVLFRPQLHHAQFPPPWVSGIFLEWWSNILKRFRGSCWTWPPRDQWPSCASGGKIKLPRTHTRQTRRGAKTERRDRCGDTHRGRHGGRKQPGWAIIVCYQALPYITDHPSLRCTSAAVPLNPRGNPPLPVQITLHRAQGSDVAQIESVQTPAHNHTDQLSAGPVLWSPRYERIFLNALYIPWLLPPHMLLSFIWGFLRGEGGECKVCRWLWQVALKGCTQCFIGFHFWTEGSGVFWWELGRANQSQSWGVVSRLF